MGEGTSLNNTFIFFILLHNSTNNIRHSPAFGDSKDANDTVAEQKVPSQLLKEMLPNLTKEFSAKERCLLLHEQPCNKSPNQAQIKASANLSANQKMISMESKVI